MTNEDHCVPDRISAVRADVRLRRRVTPETIEAIERLLDAFPESSELWSLRGEALQLLPEVDEEEVRRSLERAAALDPR